MKVKNLKFERLAPSGEMEAIKLLTEKLLETH